jgi:hypothetical protein
MRHRQLLLATLLCLLNLSLTACATPRGLCHSGFVSINPINPTTGEHQP